MTVGFDATVRCSCGHTIGPIELPDAILALLNRNPEGPILAIDELFVACPDCKQVSDYSRRVDLQIRGIANLPKIPENRLAIRARRECGVENCGFRITVHTTVDADISKSEQLRILETESVHWRFSRSVCCENGHYLTEAEWKPYLFEGLEPQIAQ